MEATPVHALWQLSWTLYLAATCFCCDHWYTVLLHWLVLLLACEVYATYVQVERLLLQDRKIEKLKILLEQAASKIIVERFIHRRELHDAHNTAMRLRQELQRQKLLLQRQELQQQRHELKPQLNNMKFSFSSHF